MVLFRGNSVLGTSLGLALVLAISASIPLSSVSISNHVMATLIWVIIFYSSVAVHLKSFEIDEDSGLSDIIKLNCTPSFIFLSKTTINTILMIIVGVLSYSLLSLWMGVDLALYPKMLLVVTLGCIGLSLSQAFAGYLLSKSTNAQMIAPLIFLPVILPVLISLIILTINILELETISINLLIVVICQSMAILLVGFLLLPIIEDTL